jgi:Tfp pilus assembly protein PilF
MLRYFREFSGLLGVAAFVSTLGCASRRALECPGTIPTVWKEIQSAHFRVVTNRPLDEARIALENFEETYDVFTSVVLSGEIPQPVPIRVVLFDKEAEFNAFGPRGAGAFFSPALPLDPEPVPTMVMWGDLVARARLTFQHELTHHLFRYALGPVPPWLGEGLADYYATVRVADGEVYIGEMQPKYEFYLNPNWQFVDTGPFVRAKIPIGDVPKADELFGLDHVGFYESRNNDLDPNGYVPMEEQKRRTARYAGSWALVHMLAHSPEYGERWANLLSLLVAGKGYAVAMDQAFGPALDSIPKAHHEYMVTHHRVAVKTKYIPNARVCPKDEQPVSESKIKTLFAQLRPFRGKTSEDQVDPMTAMRNDLDSAVQVDPRSVDALLYRGLFLMRIGEFDAAARDLEAAYKLAPENMNIMFGAASLCSVPRGPNAKVLPFCEANNATVREFIIKKANTPSTHVLASLLLLKDNQNDEAFAHAKLAVKLDPGCAACLEHLGQLMHERGMLREAIAMMERSLAALSENESGETAQKRIQQYRKELVEAAKARKKEAETSQDPK